MKATKAGQATVSRSPYEKAQALPQGQGARQRVLSLELDGMNSSSDSTTVSDLGPVIASELFWMECI